MTPTDLRRIRRHRLNPHANIWQRLGAVWAIDARYAVPGERYARNLGYGGAALDAQYGSAPTPNTNEPTLVDRGRLYLPGVTGNNVSVPTQPSFVPTFQQSIRFAGDHTSWRPAVSELFVTVNTTAGANRSWSLGLTSACQVRYSQSTSGAVNDFDLFSPDLGIPAGAMAAVRCDWTSAAGDVAFYWKLIRSPGTALAEIRSDLGWTLAATATGATVPLFASTEPLRIGAHAGTSFYTGDVFAVSITNDNVEVAAFDASRPLAQSSFPLVTGQTATVNRSASGRKVVVTGAEAPAWLLGLDDHFEVASSPLIDFGLSDSFSILAVYRRWGAGITTSAILAKKSAVGIDAGYCLCNAGNTNLQPVFQIADGVVQRGSGGSVEAAGSKRVTFGLRQAQVDLYVDQNRDESSPHTTDTLTATLANGLPLRIGWYSAAGGNRTDMELFAAAIIPRVVDPRTISLVNTEFGV